MKIILGIYLLLIGMGASANTTNLISEVCGYNYADGVKLSRSNGKFVRVCLAKEKLKEVYLTDLDSDCLNGYTQGQAYYSEFDYSSKECLKIDALKNAYSANIDAQCARGFYSDNSVRLNDSGYYYRSCLKI